MASNPNKDGASRPENTKKQIPLRLSTKLYNAIAAWAEDDFRSVNGQIEYLLTECVKPGKHQKANSSAALHQTVQRHCRLGGG